ncbi:MAG: diacylglycerol kinase family protein [Candidatus Gottesmanbacteria bacterium]
MATEIKKRTHKDSFKDAFSGLRWVLKTQPNFRFHLVLSAVALTLGYMLQVTSVEMAIIVFTIILGLTAEMINTSIESMTDLITKEYREDAKIAKDVAAGMMLVTAIGAILVAVFVFVPHILNY